MEITFVSDQLVIEMYQFPVSYDGDVSKERTYEPSRCAVMAVSYEFPDGLVKVALTAVYGLPTPEMIIGSPCL